MSNESELDMEISCNKGMDEKSHDSDYLPDSSFHFVSIVSGNYDVNMICFKI